MRAFGRVALLAFVAMLAFVLVACAQSAAPTATKAPPPPPEALEMGDGAAASQGRRSDRRVGRHWRTGK